MYLSCVCTGGLNQTTVQLDKVYSIEVHLSTILIHFILSAYICVIFCNFNVIRKVLHVFKLCMYWWVKSNYGAAG